MKNAYEIRFHGMRRSGNHAVIEWILGESPGVVVHLNDVRSGCIDPYRAFTSIKLHGISYWRCRSGLVSRLKYFCKYAYLSLPSQTYTRKLRSLNREAIRRTPHKNFLIHSYENKLLQDVCTLEFERQRARLLGESERRFDILLLRDPWNLFASMIKGGMMHEANHQQLVELWINHATEAVGESHHLVEPSVVIRFNDWFASRTYRGELLKQFGLEPRKDAYQSVPRFAGGSSFDRRDYHGNASDMDVLNRWRLMKHDPLFQRVSRDERIRHLAGRVFPDLPYIGVDRADSENMGCRSCTRPRTHRPI